MIVFSDFDDTLYIHDDPELTAENLAAVRGFRAAGGKFCLATGRSFSSLKRGLPDFSNYVDYAILDNGAVCVEPDGKEKFQFAISEDLTTDIVKFLKSSGEEFDLVFYHDMCEQKDFSGPVSKIRVWVKDVAWAEKVAKVLASEFNTKVKVYIAAFAAPSNVEWVSEEMGSFVDIAAVEAGKEQAVAKLAEMVAPGEQIITVGDGDNDSAMIMRFNGYAVKNADPATLAVVEPGHVVTSVAELLKRLCLV